MKKRSRVKPKIVVEEMIPFAEAQEIMNAHCAEIPWVGGIPSLEETDYLSEEENESLPVKKHRTKI
jgi:hypothetical protein